MSNVRTRKMPGRRRNQRLAPQRSIESLETRVLLAADVVISEFMASNTETLADSQGQYHDWVELHNRGDVEVDLERWTLRDRGAQFQMPKVILGPDEYLVLFASGSPRFGEEPFEIHTNFKLARTGEYLGLSDPAGVVVSEYNPFPSQDDDISYGLSHDDVFPQFFQQPTPGSQNASAPNVYISEFMAVNQNTLTDD